MDITSEQYSAYDKIITNEVYSYLRARGLSLTHADDMYQDCWMSILEYSKKYGKLPDYALAKTMAHRRIVDTLRKEYGSNAHFSIDTASSGDDYESDHNTWLTDNDNTDEFYADLKELRSMFPKGSKERKYLNFYIAKAGFSNEGEDEEDVITPEVTKNYGGYTDSNLAWYLGFGGTSSYKWKVFRDNMKRIISDYYGRK